MKISTGFNEEDGLEIGHIFNRLLADEYLLSAATRDYYGSVTGPEFLSLHRLFDERYELFTEYVDQVTARARAIGITTRTDWADLTQSARTTVDPSITRPAKHLLAELLALHEQLILQLRTDSETCLTRFNDLGSAAFFTGLMTQHQKTAWLLRAQLQTADAA